MLPLFIGIKGAVLALDRATGETLWETSLKGHDFVNVVLDGRQLFASTRGEVFCLDPATGRVLWNNELGGKGWGIVTIAQSADGNKIAMEENRRREEEAAAAAGTTAATS